MLSILCEFKTVAKIIYFIQPTLRCIGGLHYNLYSPGGPIPHNMAKAFDGPPTLERSGYEHRRAVTSLALLERARAWEWVKDPPPGEGQVGQKTTSLPKKSQSNSKVHTFQSPHNIPAV